MNSDLLQVLAVILGPSGAVFASLKIILNGTKGRVDKIEKKIEDMDSKIDRIAEDVAYMKGRHDGS